MKILLVDDQPLFIEGVQNLLAARGIEVAGTAADGMEALEKARELRPDVILMDIQMPRCNGLEATRLIKAELPNAKIVMLSVSADDEDLFEAIKIGASGYLLKNMNAGEFFEVITDLIQGEVPLSRGLAKRILNEFARQARGEFVRSEESVSDELTARQIEVLTLVARGFPYREVGAQLCLTESAVKYHLAQILDRLHLRTRAEAIAYATRAGLISPRRQGSD